MKILVDGRVLIHEKVTGVENYAINMINSLNKIIQVDIALPKYKNKYYAHFWEHFILPLKALKYDILFCPANIAPIFLPKKIKLVLTLHDLAFIDFPQMYSNLFRKYYSFLIPKNLKRANSIITISQFSKNRILKEFSFIKNKIDIVYHGVSKKFVYKNIVKENYILYVGALNETKNFLSVINAYKKLHEDIKLKMICPRTSTFNLSRENEKLLEEVKKNPNIKIYDYLSQEDLIQFYQKAKIFVFPSLHESFGFPILESMACGTPVICSKNTALEEIGKGSVVFCKEKDIWDIKEKISLLLNDEILQKELIKKGLEKIKEFTWEKSSEKTFLILEKVFKSENSNNS